MTTAFNIIKSALRKGGILTMGENPSAEEAADALETLNDLLASWSNDSMTVYARTLESFTLSAGTAAYTIGPGGAFDTVRPVKLISGYVRSGSIDYPLEIETEENYDSVALKSTGSIPSYMILTNTHPLAKLTFYPVPAASYQFYLRSEKPLASFTLHQEVDLPPGWKRALVHNLAIELIPEYGQQTPQEVAMIAAESKGEIRAAIMAAKPMKWETGLETCGNIYSGWNR
jgi:hypothetical protein